MSITVRITHLLIAVVAVLGVAMVESERSAVRAAAERPDPQDTQKKADGSRSVWDGVYTEEQAKRGNPLYQQECANCHGSQLNGGEAAPALVGIEFGANWGGLSLGDLFDRIKMSMPQDNPGHLSRQQTADILVYMLSMNKIPAGQKELEPDAAALSRIRFEMFKPQ